MTWPATRITKTALWQLTQPDTDAGDTRARGPRRKDARALVRGSVRVPKQSRRGTR
jgi:hypothetical protein